MEIKLGMMSIRMSQELVSYRKRGGDCHQEKPVEETHMVNARRTGRGSLQQCSLQAKGCQGLPRAAKATKASGDSAGAKRKAGTDAPKSLQREHRPATP